MKVYLVWEQDCPTDEPSLLKIFKNIESAKDFVDKMYKEFFTSCYIREWEIED